MGWAEREVAAGPARRAAKPFPRNKSECVADVLGREIVGGEIRPGEALPAEPVLLERFAVSRTALRDAFHLLIAKGLLEACPRRGTSVTAPAQWNRLDPHVLHWQMDADSAATLRQIGELRATTYPAAAALAAQHRSEADLIEHARLLGLLKGAGNKAELFHERSLLLPHAIVLAGRNELFASIAHLIHGMLAPLVPDRAPNQEVVRCCAALVDAVRKRRPDAAFAQMRTCLEILPSGGLRRPSAPDSRALR